jgi:AraC-like DNA-binding protein
MLFMNNRDNLQKTPTIIPSLAFGDDSAVVDASMRSVFENVGAALDVGAASADGFDMHSTLKDGSLHQKSSTISIGKMKLNATSSTPIIFRCDEQSSIVLRIPLFGGASHRVKGDRRQLIEQPGEIAIFHSGKSRELNTFHNYSFVLTALNEERLSKTLTSMLGPDAPISITKLNLHKDREIPLQVAGISFDKLFAQHFALIRAMEKQSHSLAMIGIDEQLYRCFVMLLAPDLFFGAQAAERDNNYQLQGKLDLACEYICAHLDDKLTLSDIEKISGMSARKLQYAFLARFGCTPLHWVRDQRLNLVHHRLNSAHEGETVTSIATACGFTNLGAFSALYQEHFNELPSATLRGALN